MRSGTAELMMGKPLRFHAIALGMVSFLSFATIACSRIAQPSPESDTSNAASTVATAADSSTDSSPAAAPVPPLQTAAALQPSDSSQDRYQEGLDRASSAFSISQSAQSSEDWQLVASQWQEAVELMQTVPSTSPHKASAAAKVKEYQRNLSVAKQHVGKLGSAPPEAATATAPRVPRPAPLAPTFGKGTVVKTAPSGTIFRAAIHRRIASTPVIKVVLNNQYPVEMIVDTGASGSVIPRSVAARLGVKPVGVVKVNTASAKNVRFPVGILQSIEVGGAVLHNVPVAIAGPELPVGLLGHDFFGQYDVTIKQDVVEFRVR